MADNILIQVVSQSEGLDETNAKLQELTQREKELVSQMDGLTKQKQQWQSSAAVVAAFDKEIEKTNTEIKSTRKSIDDLSKATKAMPGKAAADVATQSFRTMRREIEEQIKQLRLAGKTGTEEYQKLIQQAGELANVQKNVTKEISNMGSNMPAFDAVLEGTQLIAGGFSVAQGAAAMFGAESEDLQKVMVKLQSAIAITTGLQQVQNALRKESSIMQGIETFQTTLGNKARQMEVFTRAQNIAALRVQASGESAGTAAKLTGIVVTKAATITQAAFNAVAAMNPYLLLITGIGLLVGAIALFTSKTDDAAEKQKKLNELQKQYAEYTKHQNGVIISESENKIKSIENQIKILEAQGGKTKEIRDLEDEISKIRTEANEKLKKESKQQLDNLNENTRLLKMYESEVIRLNAQKINPEVSKEKRKEAEKQLEMIQSKLEAIKGNVEIGVTVTTKIEEDETSRKVTEEKRKKENIDKAKKEAIAVAEVKLIEARKGSEQELSARIAAIETQKKVELQNAELVPSERKKIILKAEKDIQDLRNEFNKKQLQDDVTLLDAQLAQSKDFDSQAYNLRLARLDAQKKAELADANLTANQRLLIEKKYSADVEKLTDDYLDYRSKTETNIKVSTIEAELASVKEGSQREHDLRVDLLQAKAQEERDSALLSIKNEDEKAAKILEINKKLKHDINQLDIEYIQTADKRSEKEILAQTKKLNQGEISEYEYNQNIKKIRLKALEDEIADRTAKKEDTVALEQEKEQMITDNLKEQTEYRKQLFSELFDAMGNIGNMFFDMQKQGLDQQMQDLQHYYTTDMEAAKKNKDLKLISEDEMARKQLEIKRKQAKAEKDQALFNAIINTAVSVAKTAATMGFPAAIPFIALAIAMGAIQIASINSKPLPTYWKGRKGGKGEYAMVGEYGPEIAWLPSGASLMPAHDTRRAIMGDGKAFDRWNMPRIEPKFSAPSINRQLVSQVLQNQGREDRILFNIDYDKLGRAVAKHAKYPKQKDVSINFDKSGLSVTEGNTTTHVLNTKYRN